MTPAQALVTEREAAEDIRIIFIFGYVELETRIRWEGDRGIGEGRRIDHNADGTIVDHGWEPTGAEIFYG